MSDKRNETTEEAAESIKQTFVNLGLNEDGSIKDKKLNPLARLQTEFKAAISEEAKATKKEPVHVREEGIEEVDEEEEQEIAEIEEEKEVKDSTAELLAALKKEIEELKHGLDNRKKNEYEDSISALNSQINDTADPEQLNRLHRQKVQLAADNFKKLNPWYNGTSAQEMKMIAAADQYDKILVRNNVPVEKALDLLGTYIRDEFPEYFSKNNTDTKKVSAVESNAGAGVAKVSKKKYNASNLSGEAKFIAKEFARLKVISEDKYVEALVKEGLLK